MRRRLAAILIAVAFMLGWHFLVPALPLPGMAPLKHIEVVRGPAPSSKTTEFGFELERFLKSLTLGVRSDLERPGVRIQLLDGSDKVLCQFGFPEQYNKTFNFSVGKGFAPGRYKIRVIEKQVVGSYAIDLWEQGPATATQKRLLLVGMAFLVTGGWYGYARVRCHQGRPPRSLRWARAAFIWAGFVAAMLVAYPLVHEGGHAIALAALGRLDLVRSDFIGLGGEPHIGRAFGGPLLDWQEAIISMAGPALPTLVGYGLFALWLSKGARRMRARALILDAFWSAFIVLFLFAHVGYVLPATGLVIDSDYSAFVEHVRLARGQVNVLLGVTGIVNVAIICTVARYWMSLVRRLKAESPAKANA